MADAVKIPKEMNTIGRLNRFIEKSIKQAPEEKMDAIGRILIAGQAVGGATGAMIAEYQRNHHQVEHYSQNID